MARPFAQATAAPTRALAWSVICFLVVPISIVFPISFTDRHFLSLPQEALSLRHYLHLFTSETWLGSIAQSLLIAISSTAIAVVAGTLCAISCWRLNSRLAELVRAVMLLPIIVPPIVYAIGLYRLFIDLKILDTFLGVIVAHAVTGIPYVVITVGTALAGFDLRLELAARSLGASIRETIWRVVVPIVMPGVLSGAVFAFVHSWDELVIVLFIAGRQVFPLSRRMWDGIQDNLDPTMAAIGSLLILLTAAAVLVSMIRIGQRQTAPH